MAIGVLAPSRLERQNSRISTLKAASCHAPPSPRTPEPEFGLHHAHVTDYVELPTEGASTSNRVRMLRADQFAQMYDTYASLDVPHHILFPYLHCGNNGNPRQNIFFSGTPAGPSLPRYRGLTVVRVGKEGESLSSATNSVLLSSVNSSDLIYKGLDGHHFHVPEPITNINMRLFGLQCLYYAMVSDIVVYSPDGLTPEACATAQALQEAHTDLFQERVVRHRNPLLYNVFIISDTFDELERVCPHLIAIGSDGTPLRHISLPQREVAEMEHFSRASPIAPNVWLGTPRDFVPDDTENPENKPTFGIGIEVIDVGGLPPSSFLELVDTTFAEYDAQMQRGENPKEQTAHLECPVSLPLGSDPQTLCEGLLNMCVWIHRHAQPLEAEREARRIILYCHDGYSESSVLALSYLMYTMGLTLDQAYMHVQLDLHRSFFVSSSDWQLLQKLEDRMPALREAHPPSQVTVAPLDETRPQFMDDFHFDGSMPSRILPFLYLGSVRHAMNSRLHQRLGITHVVSVGENCLTDAGPHTLEAARRAGIVDVLEIQNLADDGIDALRPVLSDIVQYIEQARLSGGRVLVHCRVGVSRSASTVIAYVMAHMDWSLMESYLYVRSRRLNVLIQPHVLFLWELRGWEIYLTHLKQQDPETRALPIAIGEDRDLYPTLPTKRHALGEMPLTWSSLAREIAVFNARYLSGALQGQVATM
ncbi:hypothetical protein MEQU1_001496 [Malassezia equina]|uniref:Protein-tyrosine-phosphatase n=1 Tax=Malassezia equina TaxID=1381935 RepID=A0AAF0ECT2_9BASI|nr:hypothetical protein MEQU1_001496 [Malassezia equina]